MPVFSGYGMFGDVEISKRLSEKTRQSAQPLLQKGRLDERSLGGMEGSTDRCWQSRRRLTALPVALSFCSLSVSLFLPSLDFSLMILPIPLLFLSLSIFYIDYPSLPITFLGLEDSLSQNDSSFLTLPLPRCRVWIVSQFRIIRRFWSLDGQNTPWKLAACLQ